MVVPCRHEVPDSSGRRCVLCGACLHRDIAIEGHGLPAGTAPRCLSDGERSPRIALFTYQSHSSASSAFSLLVYLAGIDGDFQRPCVCTA